MDVGAALVKLGVGLSRLLRYSFGGFLVLVLAAVVNPTGTKRVVDALTWQVTAPVAVVVGSGLYAAHRSLVIPLHHLGLCFILYLSDAICGTSPTASTSPTRWLGSLSVPVSRRMLAYTTLRRFDFFPRREKEALDLAHAEIGSVVMLAEGFAAAATYAMACPCRTRVEPLPLWLLSGAFLVASYMSAIAQHRSECLRFQCQRGRVILVLRSRGLLTTTPSSEPQGSPSVKKPILVVLAVLNAVVLLGQLWPEGAPPFARAVNLVFLFGSLAYFVAAALRRDANG